jgi:tetratricopeptide (TPR) repeat protein
LHPDAILDTTLDELFVGLRKEQHVLLLLQEERYSMRQSEKPLSSLASVGQPPVSFGTFLKLMRHRHSIRQMQVLAHLSGWTQASYSRLESDELAPAFDQLRPIATALQHAGVKWTPLDRQQFLTLARERIETKKTYQEHKTEQQWEELRLALARLDAQAVPQEHAPSAVGRGASRPRLLETRHLVGRQEWLASVIASLQETLPKKLVVLQGPVGIGKSSELHRLALHFLAADTPRPHVLLCELPAVERESGPENALDVVLATLLVEVGPADAASQMSSLEARMALVLTCLEKTSRALLLLVDNAEHLLDEQGRLAPCWQQFLGSFLRSQHRACLVVATKEWPGWSEGERVFVAEYVVPALSAEAGAQVLQQLGLASVARQHLQQVSHAVGGVPLCLEWVAALAQEPLLGDDWQGILEDAGEQAEQEARQRESLTHRLLGLLEDPSLFGGHVAAKLTPLLERILHNRLSTEATELLHVLSLANIALGKPAVQRVCSHPRVLKELRNASLLMAYSHRVQVLPMVAALVHARVSPAQQQQGEEHLIDALSTWLDEGKANDHEMGALIAELALLYLKHHHLLEAADLLLYYGWLSFQQGYAQRLAKRLQTVLSAFGWRAVPQDECGGLLLHYYLLPFLGLKVNERERAEAHQRILTYIWTDQVAVKPFTVVHLIHTIMLSHMNMDHFEQAQRLLDECFDHMKALLTRDSELHAVLVSKRGWLLRKRAEYAREQGLPNEAKRLGACSLEQYEHSIRLLREGEQEVNLSPLRKIIFKKKLAIFLNNLSCRLEDMGRCEEALQVIEECIELEEQGYVDFGALAASYGTKSQLLASLGRFREALRFDEKAREEVQRCVKTGDSWSQDEAWMYQVNQGRLYLRVGRIDEAEHLLCEAQPYIAERRKFYRQLAKEALMEIKHTRHSPHPYQLDWRWVERYRELDAYDAYWWWASAGPFTPEEQYQWDRLFSAPLDQASKDQLGTLLARSRHRELEAALRAQREPQLSYPAIDIEELRQRIVGFLQLDAEIAHDEPNAVVRRLYHGTIEDELCFIRAIEATYEANSERFWELNRQINPPPTYQEMQYALARVKQVALLGSQRTDTIDVSKRVMRIMQEHLHLALDLSAGEEHVLPLRSKHASSVEPQRMLSAQATQRFFETVLREAGLDGWQAVLDASASGVRVDSAMRTLFLPDAPMQLETIRGYFIHEFLGHVSRSAAGEHSLLALLGMNTKGYAPTEEGLALYHERTIAALHGEAYDDSGSWLGTLAVGLASGVMTPPQTFSRVFAFFEPFLLLYRLLWRSDEDRLTAEERAHKGALTRCLRTFRGVPDLEQAGICHTRDTVYLRGRLAIEEAVAQDETVLDRLAVGKVALELLPDLHELGIVSVPHTVRALAYAPDLDAYILSFQKQAEEASEQHV